MTTKIIVALTLSFACSAQAKLKIMTTTTTLADIVRAVGEDKTEVTSLTKSTQDPHYVEAKPSYMVKIRNADLLVAVGLELETGWLANIQRGAKNPKLLDKARGFFEAGDFINPIEVPSGKIDRSHGDVHASGNPHFHLDPIKITKVIAALAKKLSELDPSNKNFYSKNADNFVEKINSKNKEWGNRVQKSKVKKVVTYHKSFNYLLKRYGIKTISNIEPNSGVPPTAKHIINLIKKIKEEKVKCLLNESYFETAAARRLQKETGAKLQILDVESSGDYLKLIDNIVTAIEGCSYGSH